MSAYGRYDLPDPKCQHKPKGFVDSGTREGAHASTYVCDRPACIADALEWARAVTHLPARHVAHFPPGKYLFAADAEPAQESLI